MVTLSSSGHALTDMLLLFIGGIGISVVLGGGCREEKYKSIIIECVGIPKINNTTFALNSRFLLSSGCVYSIEARQEVGHRDRARQQQQQH